MAILDTKIGMLPSNRIDLKQNNKSSIFTTILQHFILKSW